MSREQVPDHEPLVDWFLRELRPTPVDPYSSKQQTLVVGLSQVLTQDGFGNLCPHPEAPRRSRFVDDITRWTWLILPGLALCYALFTEDRLFPSHEPPRLFALFVGFLAFMVLGGAALDAVNETVAVAFAVACLIALPATFAYEAAVAGLGSTVTTHLVPLAASILIMLLLTMLGRLRAQSLWRAVRIGAVLAATPWLVPITLLIVVVPLFSEDLWTLAAQATPGRIAALAGVTILPMTAIVLWRLVVSGFDTIVTDASRKLHPADGSLPDDLERTVDEVLERIELLRGSATRTDRFKLHWRRLWSSRAERRKAGHERHMLTASYAAPAFDFYVRYTQARLRTAIAVQATFRTILLVGGIAAGSAAYIYAIAWIVVPADQAATWGRRSRAATVDTYLWFDIPTGPHLLVAALTAVIATAIFLALVITTKEIENAFHGTASHGPLKKCLAFSIPCLKLLADEQMSSPTQLTGASGTEQVPKVKQGKTPVSTPGRASASYVWRASCEGFLTVDTEESEYETSLTVCSGAGDDASQLVPSGERRAHIRVSPGDEYTILVDGFAHDGGEIKEGDVVLRWMTNDTFASAFEIGMETGTVRGGHNKRAGHEPEERLHAGIAGQNSVWYRWTAPRDRDVTIDTVGSSFDTLLAVYTGDDLHALTEIASNDDVVDGARHSRVRFPARKDQSYAIVVDGYDDEAGEVVLNLGPPDNDDLAAAALLSGPRGSEQGTNAAATKEPGEPHHAGNAGGASVWYRWTAPVDGEVTLDTAGSDFDTLLAVYTGSSIDDLVQLAANDDVEELKPRSRARFEVTEGGEYLIAVDGAGGATGRIQLNWDYLPAHDHFRNAQPIGDLAGTASSSNRGARRETGEPQHAGKQGGASVWYRWTAPADGYVTLDTAGSDFDTLLGVYVGTSVDKLNEIASNDDATGLGSRSRVQFAAEDGVPYSVAIDGYNGATGDFVLTWCGPPDNDAFETAQALSGSAGTQTADNRGATKDAAEPDHAGRTGGASVWYRWTAPTDGELTVDTAGSDFDTLLAVYTGTSLDRLKEVAANDDAPDLGWQSRVSFRATQGTDYVIAVDGLDGERGAIKLNWSLITAPSHDAFERAREIQGPTGSLKGSNRGAAKQRGEPDHAGEAGGASVWYRWTAPAHGKVTIDTVGSDFDTLLAVYTGASVQSLHEVAANDDAVDVGVQSRVHFRVRQGEEYSIAVDGWRGVTGALVLNWELVRRDTGEAKA